MKKGQELEIEIIGIEFPNKPYGIHEERKVYPEGNFIKGSRVKGAVTKIRNKKIKMKRVEVVKKSPNEIEPLCQHFNLCGGCTFQNMTYDDQIELKSHSVFKILNNVSGVPFIYEKIIKSPKKFEYRNKMEFSFGNEYINGPLTLGMHKKGSFHDVITVSGCKLMDEDFRKILNATANYFKENKIDFYHRLQHKGYLRNMVIRKGEKTGEIGINLITTSQMDFELSTWKDLLLNLQLKNKISGIIHTVNDSLSDSVQSEKEYLLFGNRDINEKIFNLNFKISPYSFFQTNSEGVELLYGKVMNYIEEIENFNNRRPVIFDLFSGTGTIGQIISKKAEKVYGIEIVEEAVIKAMENVAENNISNVEFLSGDVFNKLETLNMKNIKPDVIILDPPRSGVGEKTINKLIEYSVANIIYVSCNPKTFATDLEVFQKNGYVLKKACPVDMFPQTPHIEVVAMLEKTVK